MTSSASSAAWPEPGGSDNAVAPVAPAGAEAFYARALTALTAIGVPFLLAGTYALSAYTGIERPTKDLDIFTKPGDFPRVLAHFQSLGHAVEIEDERWIGKLRDGAHFIDVIFACAAGTMPVTDSWFADAPMLDLFGARVAVVPPTELLAAKSFIQLRHRFDGPDVMHLILRQHARLDWRRLLELMEQHWEVLLAHVLTFRWIYPTERDHVPDWLIDELLERLRLQRALPLPRMKVCRGRMLSHIDYLPDVQKWGFADIGGHGEQRE
jgi:hypothetical protein